MPAQIKLYAHECCECGGAMSYSQEPDILPDALCKDCAATFIDVSGMFGLEVTDQHHRKITSQAIYLESRAVSEDWMSNARGRLLKWRKLRGECWNGKRV